MGNEAIDFLPSFIPESLVSCAPALKSSLKFFYFMMCFEIIIPSLHLILVSPVEKKKYSKQIYLRIPFVLKRKKLENLARSVNTYKPYIYIWLNITSNKILKWSY